MHDSENGRIRTAREASPCCNASFIKAISLCLEKSRLACDAAWIWCPVEGQAGCARMMDPKRKTKQEDRICLNAVPFLPKRSIFYQNMLKMKIRYFSQVAGFQSGRQQGLEAIFNCLWIWPLNVWSLVCQRSCNLLFLRQWDKATPGTWTSVTLQIAAIKVTRNSTRGPRLRKINPPRIERIERIERTICVYTYKIHL